MTNRTPEQQMQEDLAELTDYVVALAGLTEAIATDLKGPGVGLSGDVRQIKSQILDLQLRMSRRR